MTDTQAILQAIEALAKEVRELRQLLGVGESHGPSDYKGYFDSLTPEGKNDFKEFYGMMPGRPLTSPITPQDEVIDRHHPRYARMGKIIEQAANDAQRGLQGFSKKRIYTQPSPYSE